jgi:hypothetical protein
MGAPFERTTAVVLAAALLAGAVVYVNVRLRSPAVDHAIRFVPADADAYLHVFLKPSTQQRRELQSLLEAFPETDDDAEAETFVSELLTGSLERLGVAVDENAGEWLGNEAATYLPDGSRDPVVLLEVEDEGAARAGLKEVVEDGSALVFTDGFAIISPGQQEWLDASAAADGSLGEAPAYRSLIGELTDHRIALLYTDGSVGPVDRRGAAVLYVRGSTVVLDVATGGGADLTNLLRGYLIASITGARGVLTLDTASRSDTRAIVDAVAVASSELGLPVQRAGNDLVVSAPSPFPEMVMVDSAQGLVVRVGDARGAEGEVPAALGQAARRRLGPAYEPTLVVDATSLPAGARTLLLRGETGTFAPILERFLTLNLGFRRGPIHGFMRLIVTFGDA